MCVGPFKQSPGPCLRIQSHIFCVFLIYHMRPSFAILVLSASFVAMAIVDITTKQEAVVGIHCEYHRS